MTRGGVVGGVLVALLVVAAVLAPVLAPYDPQGSSGPSLQPPSASHPLGTNNLGQDVLSRLVWGARTSLAVAAGATAIALGLGGLVGIGAGLLGGLPDLVAMRVVDLLIALPRLPLLILVATLAGAGGTTIAVLVGLLAWAPVARVLRGQTRTLRHRGWVHAARGFGGGPAHLARRHLVPALARLLVAELVAVAGGAILVEASLAFLGLADATSVSWGLDVQRALAEPGIYFTPAWLWWVLPTGGVISLAVLACTLLGTGLDPLLDRRAERWA